MKRKSTAADRPQFRRDMAKMMVELGVKAAEIDQDVMLVCSRAEDFDPADNVLWELEANRSAVRPDVLCFSCKSPLAMSNDAYGKYQRLDRKPRVCCIQCVVKVVGPE